MSFESTRSHSDEPSKTLHVNEVNLALKRFGWPDYLVFVAMLLVCAAIGIYFGFFEKRKKLAKGKTRRETEERHGSEELDYLVGNRRMKVFPVSMSLVASFVSGISLLGTSTEIYVYGTQYAFILIAIALSGIISWLVFLPVFCDLQLTSTYEYLELRFDKRIRLYGSILYTIGTTFWLPIVIYVPALAFNQVTGINIHVITPVVCVVCIFYTCVGGLKAVIWTDVIQSLLMLGSVLLVIIKGTIDVGGPSIIFQRNYNSGRLEAPVFTIDPTVRYSYLSVIVGGTSYWLQATSGNQVIVQRFLSLPSRKHAKLTLLLFCVGMSILYCFTFYNGLLIYAKYYDCDPLSTKLIKAKDQLVPLLVMDILGFLPGLPGLFVAGVFSAALSSLSTALNSLSAVFLQDFIKPSRRQPLTERQTAIILRSVVVLIGTLCVILVSVVEHLGMVLQLSMTVSAMTMGPLLGIFLMGLLVPWMKSNSAFTGGIVSFCVMIYVCIRAQFDQAVGQMKMMREKPVSTAGCLYRFEEPVSYGNSSLLYNPPSKSLHHMSYLCYVPFGAFLCIVVASLSSCYFGLEDPNSIDKSVIAPVMRRFVQPQKYTTVVTSDTGSDERKGELLTFDVRE